MDATDALPVLATLADLCALVDAHPRGTLYVRYSHGPAADASGHSVDHESRLELPGLSVNPLSPEPWWTRPLADWLARQLCNYAHLADEDPSRYAWVLTGPLVGRGPDNEPLVAPARPIARLEDDLVDEAERHYRARFDVGRDSTGG